MKRTVDSPTLLVLAAGMGNRYGGLKQLVPVDEAGGCILDYSVYDAVRAGFTRVVFVIRKEIEKPFKAAVGSRMETHVEVAYAFQELNGLPPGYTAPLGRMKPWGTLQATLVGAELTAGPFAVINADDFYGPGSFLRLAGHLRKDPVSCAMIGFPLRNTLSKFGPVSRGLCTVDPSGMLLQVVETAKIVRDGIGARSLEASESGARFSGEEIVSMNMWAFHHLTVAPLRLAFEEFLQSNGSDLMAECYLPAAVNGLIAAGQAEVRVLRTDDAWFGMTYSEDHAKVTQRIRDLVHEGRYPNRPWAR